MRGLPAGGDWDHDGRATSHDTDRADTFMNSVDSFMFSPCNAGFGRRSSGKIERPSVLECRNMCHSTHVQVLMVGDEP